MNCELLKKKILSNEQLDKEEYDHIRGCVECREIHDFNASLTKIIRQNLQYPHFSFEIPEIIKQQARREKYMTVLRPAFSYAFMLVVGVLIGYFAGDIITHGSFIYHREESRKERARIVKMLPSSPIVTNDYIQTSPQETVFAVPLDKTLKKELNLPGGVIVKKVDEIKKILTNCIKGTGGGMSGGGSFSMNLADNDIIIEVNGIPVENQEVLGKKLSSECDNLKLKIMRNGLVMNVIIAAGGSGAGSGR